MSQKPAPSVPAPVRVSGGVPWWLWLILVVFGGSIVTTLVRKSIPEDPNLYFQHGIAALEAGDGIAAEKDIQKLKKYPEYAAKQKLLEGILNLGISKPLLAVPLLQEASQEPEIRIRALAQLGNAYLRSGQRVDCIAVYETALQEDENADESRLSLAGVLKEILSWEDSLKHLKILQEHNFRPGVVGGLIADIYSDSDQFADAATEYEAAIRADPTDATNSRKAHGLIKCRIETGDLTGLEEFMPLVDSADFRESVLALELSGKNDSEQALAAIGKVLQENPGDAFANRIYGQIMANTGSKEKAVETLKNLRKPLEYNARNLKLFEVVARLATIAEEEELAAVVQQNVDQLRDQESQCLAKLNEVIRTRDDTKARFDLGDLALTIGRLQLAQLSYQSATLIDNTTESTVEEKMQSLYKGQLPLVPVDDAFIQFETDEAPTESAPESATNPETENPKNPAKPETDAASPDEPAETDDSARIDDSAKPVESATEVPESSSDPKPD